MHLASCQLLGFQAFLVSTTAGRLLSTFALSNDFILCFFKLAAIYMFGCIRRPKKFTLSVFKKKIRDREGINFPV